MKPLRIMLALFACLFLAACGTGGGAGTTAGPAQKPVSGGAGQSGSSNDASSAFNAQAPKQNSVDVLTATGSRQVIQDANLSLRIKSGSFWQTYDKALAVVDRFNGYVSSSHIGDQSSKEVDSGTIVLRVPVASYQDAVQALQDLGTTTQLQVSSEDVSEQYVDLNARLKNQQAQQAILLDLMRKATSIQDSIAVQNQLSGVTAEVERIQGQLRFLDSRTNYSTITVNLFVVAPAAVEPTLWDKSGLSHSFQTAGQAFTSVVGGMIVTLGFLAPFAILIALALGIWRALPASIRPSFPKP